MSHEIDQSNGRENMAYVGAVPWHGLGNQLTVDADIDTWKTEAGLDWQAVGATVEYKDMVGEQQEYEQRFVLFRSDTGLPLSIVSDRYNAVQPTQVLEFFREYVEGLGAFTMETAGSLRGGSKIWALAKANDDLSFGEDQIQRYLLLATSYDLSIPTLVKQTSVRVVCQNTLDAAVGQGANNIRVKHITAFNADLVKQKIMLDKNWETFAKFIKKMTKAKVKSNDNIREYFLDVFYPEALRQSDAFSEKGAEKRINDLQEVFEQGPGADLKSARGTAWGLVNAVTFFVDHQQRSRSQDLRLDKAWFGEGSLIKQRALDFALVMAN